MKLNQRWTGVLFKNNFSTVVNFNTISYFGLSRTQPLFFLLFENNQIINDNSLSLQTQYNFSSNSFLFFKFNFFLKYFFLFFLVFFYFSLFLSLENIFYNFFLNYSVIINFILLIFFLLFLLYVRFFFIFFFIISLFFSLFNFFFFKNVKGSFLLQDNKKLLNVTVNFYFYKLKNIENNSFLVTKLNLVYNLFSYLNFLEHKKFNNFQSIQINNVIYKNDNKFFQYYYFFINKDILQILLNSNYNSSYYLNFFFLPQWFQQIKIISNFLYLGNLYNVNNLLPVNTFLQNNDFWGFHRNISLFFSSSSLLIPADYFNIKKVSNQNNKHFLSNYSEIKGNYTSFFSLHNLNWNNYQPFINHNTLNWIFFPVTNVPFIWQNNLSYLFWKNVFFSKESDFKENRVEILYQELGINKKKKLKKNINYKIFF